VINLETAVCGKKSVNCKNFAFHPAKAGYPLLRDEMQIITEYKASFILITLGLSEAAVRNPAKGARHEIENATPKCACNHAMTV